MSKISLVFADPVADEYRWFAWYPVSTTDRGLRWMQFVYKRKYCPHDYLPGALGTFFMYSVEKGVLS